MTKRPKLLVVQCAALGWNLLEREEGRFAGLTFAPLSPVLPAVTCTAQASFRTAALPSEHGMVANGLYHRRLRKPLFWEQAAEQVQGERIWQDFRKKGGTVGMMFWQQSLGEPLDLVLSPRPIHKHRGGMLQDCYSQPGDLFDRLSAKIKKPFNLMHYWGPLASHKSSDWIVAATEFVLQMPDVRPDVLLTYLPHLDYDLQRHGPEHPKSARALERLDAYLRRLTSIAETEGYDLLVFGDYAIHSVNGPAIFPNRALRDAGLFQVRTLKGAAYPDLWYSPAFAVVDHEIAHIVVNQIDELERVRAVLDALEGVDRVFSREEADVMGLNHPNSGDLIALSQPGRWFAYPWWTEKREAPDFATHVDIHNKPGFDPCELFFGRVPWHVSQDSSKIGGSHGAVGPASQVAWASTRPFQPVNGLCELAAQVKQMLDA